MTKKSTPNPQTRPIEVGVLSFQDLYYYDSTYRIIICKSCQYAILPHTLEKHTKTSHSYVNSNPDSLKRVLTQANALRPVPYKTTVDIVIPTEPIPAYPSLATKQATMCTISAACRKIYAGDNAVRNMETHQVACHNQEVAQADEIHKDDGAEKKGKGRPTKEQADLIAKRRHQRMRPVFAQRFFHTSGQGKQGSSLSAASYFEVLPPTSLARTGGRSGDDGYDTDSSVDSDAANWSDTMAAARQQREDRFAAIARTIPAPQSNQTNPWLEATGWQHKLSGMDFGHVESLSKPPSPSDGPVEQTLWHAVKTMVRVWQYNVHRFSKRIRTAILLENVGRPPTNPFEPYQNHDTKHASTLQHLFMFFYRTCSQADDKPYPAYKFDRQQREAWDALVAFLAEAASARSDALGAIRHDLDREPERATLHPLELLCHEFWLALVKQNVVASEDELTLVNALSSRAVTADGYRHPGTVSTDLSEMKKMGRFAFLQELSRCFPTVDENQRPTPLSVVQEWTRDYLSMESSNAVQWIIATQIDIRRIQRDVEAEGSVLWDGPRLTYLHHTVDTNAWKQMVRDHYEVTQGQLLHLLYVDNKEELPRIPWDLLLDRPGELGHGYHIFNGERNPALRGKDDFVEDQRKRQLRSEHGRTQWKSTIYLARREKTMDCIAQQAKDVRQFLVSLATLIHLSYGQPARATELLSVRYSNTYNHGLRDIFLVKGLLAIVPRWHKGYTQTKKPKAVWRFIPRPVGNLLFWYLWLVLPHFQTVQGLVPTDQRGDSYEQAYSEFLFPNAKGQGYEKDGTMLSNAIGALTNASLGQIITVRPARHMIVAMGRQEAQGSGDFMVLDHHDVENAIEEADADALETQAGHSVSTGHLAYANLIGQFASRLRDRYWKISSRWHRYIGYTLTKEQRDVLGAGTPGEVPRPSKQDSGQRFAPSRRTTAPIPPNPVRSARADRAVALASVDPRGLLIDLYGPGSSFRGEQEKVLADIFTDKSPVVYVAGTGSGKSLAFLLPATCPDFGLQVLVVPLVGLRLDMVRRCAALGIACVEWSPGVTTDYARIVLVMPEHVSSPEFIMFVEAARSVAHIGRIVIDEAHYILQTGPSFRQMVSNLSQLVLREIPITALTATLPPEEEGELFARLSFPRARVALHRERTSRPNIQYRVERMGPMDPRAVANDCQRRKSRGGHRKAIVFVAYQNQARTLASRLGCGCFDGTLDNEQKSKLLADFTAADDALLVATSSLGHGVHDPGVDLVLHYGSPDGLKLYAQETGRAGRSGREATAQVVLPEGFPTWLDARTDQEKARVARFLNEDGDCRRKALDLYLDGDPDRVRCLDHEAPCDVCERNRSIDPALLAASSAVSPFRHREPEGELADSVALGDDSEYAGLAEVASETLPPAALSITPKRKRSDAAPHSSTEMSRTSPRPRIEVPQTPESGGAHDGPLAMLGPTPFERVISSGGAASTPASSVASPTPATHPAHSTVYREAVQATEQHAHDMADMRGAVIQRNKAAAHFTSVHLPSALAWWKEHCVRCLSNRKAYDHPLCAWGVCQLTKDVSVQLKVREFLVCYKCLLPQKSCERMVHIPQSGSAKGSIAITKEKCKYAFVAKDVWSYIYTVSSKERTFLEDLMRKNRGDGCDTKPGGNDFGPYYSADVELSNRIRVPRLVVDFVAMTDALQEGRL